MVSGHLSVPEALIHCAESPQCYPLTANPGDFVARQAVGARQLSPGGGVRLRV